MSLKYFSAAGVAAAAMVAMLGSVLHGTVHATECRGSAKFPRVVGLDINQYGDYGPPNIG